MWIQGTVMQGVNAKGPKCDRLTSEARQAQQGQISAGVNAAAAV